MFPRLGDNNGIGAMHLIGGDDLRFRSTKGFRNHVPVAHDSGALITRTQPAIERGENAFRGATLTAKEAVGDIWVFEFVNSIMVSRRDRALQVQARFLHNFEQMAHVLLTHQPCNGSSQSLLCLLIGL